MRISYVRTHPLARSLDTPLRYGGGTFDTFCATLVEIGSNDGTVGVGECIGRRSPSVTATIVDTLLAPLLFDRDPRDVEGLWDEMFGMLRRWGHSRGFALEAISGVDVALHDLLARAQGIPVYKLLGGHGRARVTCYASSVYIAGIEEMVREATGQVALGHAALKVKIGRPASLGGIRADVDSIREIRLALGPGVELMLDANSAYDAATAIRVAALAHAYNLAYAPHTGFSGGVEHLAALHLSAAAPNFTTYEYFYSPNALREIFTSPFPRALDGTVALPVGPGLGLDLDWDLVRRHTVPR
ncbi:MAG: mandelate racemase/muconate lactonizing enzyme family protein [Acidimicrobiia bacterium]